MSRNARFYRLSARLLGGLLCLLSTLAISRGAAPTGPLLFTELDTNHARVVIVQNPSATDAFAPNPAIIRTMVHRGLLTFSGKQSIPEAWQSLLSTQDTVGIKVLSGSGSSSGTRPCVVAAVVESLLQSGVPPRQIVVWDKHLADLRLAGFLEFKHRYGIRVEASAAAGYDDTVFYETPLLGQLVFGDLEFARKEDGIGRKSFVSKLLTKELTRIINITPLLNHNRAGVSGNLYGLSMGSVDNNIRFEVTPNRLATAVPEIYNMPQLADKVVLNLVDALLCQYQGEQSTMLHYSAPLNQLRFSKDPVALDVLSLLELDRQRQAADIKSPTNYMELYQNAALLQLGVSDLRQIHIERVQ